MTTSPAPRLPTTLTTTILFALWSQIVELLAAAFAWSSDPTNLLRRGLLVEALQNYEDARAALDPKAPRPRPPRAVLATSAEVLTYPATDVMFEQLQAVIDQTILWKPRGRVGDADLVDALERYRSRWEELHGPTHDTTGDRS